MDRERLARYLERDLSLGAIGALENLDRSTVGYWVAKHGLEATGRDRHAARGPLTREQLEPLVEQEMTLREMAAVADRSVSTVRYWLKKHGLLVPRWRREQALAARDAGTNRSDGRCRVHGPTEFLALPDGRSRCARCNSKAVSSSRRRIKATLIAEAGGRCVLCGYDTFDGALHFHHPNPEEKAFGLAEAGATRALARAREEARKCVLLCANCHAEVEGGVSTLSVK